MIVLGTVGITGMYVEIERVVYVRLAFMFAFIPFAFVLMFLVNYWLLWRGIIQNAFDKKEKRKKYSFYYNRFMGK